MRDTRNVHFIVGGLLVGIYSARYFPVTLTFLLLITLLLVVCIVRFSKLWPLAFLLAGVMVGVVRSEPVIHDYAFLKDLEGEKVVLQATVVTDPVYHESGQYEFNANNLRYENRRIDATIRIRSYTNDVRRGDRVEVSGALRDGFASWQASMYFAQLDILDRDETIINGFRQSFIASIYSSVPDPEASLGLGFLIGIRTLLPEELTTQLSITGLTHIVAVSGYNLTVLVTSSKRLLSRFSRFQALSGSLSLLAVFVLITGWSPSVTRAVIVAMVSLGSWYYGRQAKPWVLLLYSSSLSALLVPAYAWGNIGWYLSLLAFYGVLVVAPAVQRRVFKDRDLDIIRQIIIETSAAQLMTMPLIMLIFGEVSVIALLANALVLPLIPFAMLATFILGIAVMVFPLFAGIIAIPCYFILQAITSIILAMSKVSWALIDAPLSLIQMIVTYAGIFFLSWVLVRSLKRLIY